MTIAYKENVPNPRAWGYDGDIDNLLIRLAVSRDTPLIPETAPATAPRIDTSESGEDIRDEVGQRYSRTDLSGGAGLDFMHKVDRPDDARIRFWDSKGVDPFRLMKGEPYCVRLLHSMASDTTYVNTNTFVAEIDGTIYYTDDAEVWEYGASPAKATESASIKQFRALGNNLYTLNATDGVTRYDPATSWTGSNVSTTNFDDIWAVKGRVLGVVDNILYEAGGTDTTLITLAAGETFTDVIDVGSVIVALATTGEAFILSLDNTLALGPAGQSRFTDETPNIGAATNDVVFFTTTAPNDNGGTVARFYVASVQPNPDSTYSLANQQLVWQLGDEDTTEDLTPMVAFTTRDSVYVGVKDEGANTVTFWRYYLPTGGYARAEELPFTSALTVSSVAVVNDRIWAAAHTDGLWKEQDTYVATGYVILPAADHFTADDKQWVSTRTTLTAPLPTDTSVVVYDSTDLTALTDPASVTWTQITSFAETQTEKDVNLTNRVSRYHLIKLEMTSSGTQVSTPCLGSMSVRSYPNPDRDEVWLIPLNVSDQYESPQRRRQRRRGRGTEVRKVLERLAGTQVRVTLYQMDIRLDGLVESVQPPVVSHPDYGSPTNVLLMRVRGKQVLEGETVSGMTYGTTMWGVGFRGGLSA